MSEAPLWNGLDVHAFDVSTPRPLAVREGGEERRGGGGRKEGREERERGKEEVRASLNQSARCLGVRRD